MTSHGTVESILNYTFKNASLLDEALQGTGGKPAWQSDQPRRHSNKPLAMIGDALVRLVIYDDGVVEGDTPETCHHINTIEASNLNLGYLEERLNLDRHVREPHTTKGGASAMEAILGAVWLDCGRDYERFHPVVHHLQIAKSLEKDRNHGSDGC